MRVIGGTIGRDPDRIQQLRGAGRRLFLRRIRLVQLDRLAELMPDRVHRIQGVHRPLEHDRDATPPHVLHEPLVETDQLLIVERDRAGDRGGLRKELRQREGQRRLAAPGLTGEAKHLPSLEPKVDTGHRLDRGGLGPVAHAQVVDLEQAHRRSDNLLPRLCHPGGAALHSVDSRHRRRFRFL